MYYSLTAGLFCWNIARLRARLCRWLTVVSIPGIDSFTLSGRCIDIWIEPSVCALLSVCLSPRSLRMRTNCCITTGNCGGSVEHWSHWSKLSKALLLFLLSSAFLIGDTSGNSLSTCCEVFNGLSGQLSVTLPPIFSSFLTDTILISHHCHVCRCP